MKREIALRIPLVFEGLSKSSTKPVYTKTLREKVSKLLFETSTVITENQNYLEKIEKEFIETTDVGEKNTWDDNTIKNFYNYLNKHDEYRDYLKEEVEIKTKITLSDLDDSDYDVAIMSALFGVLITE